MGRPQRLVIVAFVAAISDVRLQEDTPKRFSDDDSPSNDRTRRIRGTDMVGSAESACYRFRVAIEVVLSWLRLAAEREGDAGRRRRTSRPPDPLLIVEPLRRHVGEEDGIERADIDAGLHGRRYAEQVNAVETRRFRVAAPAQVIEEDTLEAALTILSVNEIGLTS